MTLVQSATPPRLDKAEFRRGFEACVPLWLGVTPFAIAFAVLARTSGLTALETGALSFFVFAGSAQLAFVTLAKEDAAALAIIGTTVLLNLRHVLYGLSLNAYFPAQTAPKRPVLAALMTDESYGLTIRALTSNRGGAAFLFGASVSLYACYATSTVVGIVAGRIIPNPERLRLEVIFPLSFLALLLPLVRRRSDVVVAIAAAAMALVLSRITSGGVTILIATVVAASLGSWLHSHDAGHA